MALNSGFFQGLNKLNAYNHIQWEALRNRQTPLPPDLSDQEVPKLGDTYLILQGLCSPQKVGNSYSPNYNMCRLYGHNFDNYLNSLLNIVLSLTPSQVTTVLMVWLLHNKHEFNFL